MQQLCRGICYKVDSVESGWSCQIRPIRSGRTQRTLPAERSRGAAFELLQDSCCSVARLQLRHGHGVMPRGRELALAVPDTYWVTSVCSGSVLGLNFFFAFGRTNVLKPPVIPKRSLLILRILQGFFCKSVVSLNKVAFLGPKRKASVPT